MLLPVQAQLKEHYPRTVSLVKNLVSPLPEEYRFLTEVLLSVLLSGEISETIPYKRSSWRMVNRLPQVFKPLPTNYVVPIF